MVIDMTHAGEQLLVRLVGRFDFTTRGQFIPEVEEALPTVPGGEIRIDMSGVEYIDSSALGMLLLSRENCTGAGKTIRITNPRGTVKEVLHIASFEKLFTIE